MPEAWEVQETQSVGDCADCCEECTPELCGDCPSGTGFLDPYPCCLVILNFRMILFVPVSGVLRVTINGPLLADQSATLNGVAWPTGGGNILISVGCFGPLAYWNMGIQFPSSLSSLQSPGSTYLKCDPLAVSWLGAQWAHATWPDTTFIDMPDMVSYLEAGAC